MKGAWKTATIAITETLSGEVNLGMDYENVLVLIPTIDNSTQISVQVAKDVGGTMFPVHDWNDSDADGTVLQATVAGAGGIAVVFKIGGAQLIKLLASVAQDGGARTFYVRGC